MLQIKIILGVIIFCLLTVSIFLIIYLNRKEGESTDSSSISLKDQGKKNNEQISGEKETNSQNTTKEAAKTFDLDFVEEEEEPVGIPEWYITYYERNMIKVTEVQTRKLSEAEFISWFTKEDPDNGKVSVGLTRKDRPFGKIKIYFNRNIPNISS